MKEEGIVVEVYGNLARVEAEKSSSCGGCGAKNFCKPGGGNSIIVEALNPIHAEPGERVRFEVTGRVLLQSSFLLYILPIVFLVIGAGLGGKLAPLYPAYDKDALSALLGILFLVLGVFILNRAINYWSRKADLKPVITEVVG